MEYYLCYDKDFNMDLSEVILWDKGLEKCVCECVCVCSYKIM